MASLALCGIQAQAGDLGINLRITVDDTQFDQQSAYAVPQTLLPQVESSSEQNLELGWQRGGVNLTATLRNRASKDSKPHNEAFFNELYYDTQLAGQDISLGRKITSWGVGFGFRPLDVLQQEDRRTLYQNTLRGIDQLAWEKFYDSAALSLIWANPGQGKSDPDEQQSKAESLALKFYDNVHGRDIHAVARYSDHTGLQLGTGISSVYGDSLEWHGSMLWQQDFSLRINRLTLGDANNVLAIDNPFIDRELHDGIKALAGASWTHGSGWGVLGEIWYDGTAYSEDDWQNLNRLTDIQRQLLIPGNIPESAILGNIAYNQQAFQADNLLQWNTLLRLSRQDANLEPVLEVLYTPEDQGWVTTAKVDYKLNKQRLQAGLRFFGGADEAAYSLLPQDRQVFVSWQGSF